MTKRVTAPALLARKGTSQKIVCLTAYDLTSAQICDEAGADLILVGDSVGNVVLGYDTTVEVTLSDMVHHVRAARRGVKRALLVADMPFGSYNSSTSAAVEAAVELARAGAEAVKLEGSYVEAIIAIRKAGIPVMGHVGFTPQSVNAFGGFRVQGRGDQAAFVRDEACQVAEAGVFSMVLELIPAELARQITQDVAVPTVGIGAGPHCDGQIQVFHDVTGLASEKYRHAKRYVAGRTSFIRGLKKYAAEVQSGEFPNEENSF